MYIHVCTCTSSGVPLRRATLVLHDEQIACDTCTYIHVYTMHTYCALGDLHFYIQGCVIYGCLQPRELWLIDFNHACIACNIIIE